MLKSILTNAHMKRMERYSARNNNKKLTDAYSVLNPLTSSDSPSEKSNGERFVSAKATTKVMIITGKRKEERTTSLGVGKAYK